MPALAIWGLIAIGVFVAGGYAAQETSNAASSTGTLIDKAVTGAVVLGALYVGAKLTKAI